MTRDLESGLEILGPSTSMRLATVSLSDGSKSTLSLMNLFTRIAYQQLFPLLYVCRKISIVPVKLPHTVVVLTFDYTRIATESPATLQP
ncbi:hypothetical protein OPQ81_004207 [Rhizoctonia solani]|nr:hypothetical protein OPQ81_004207 [Rhizoctonia solani]